MMSVLGRSSRIMFMGCNNESRDIDHKYHLFYKILINISIIHSGIFLFNHMVVYSFM